jgi:hypothetical protein
MKKKVKLILVSYPDFKFKDLENGIFYRNIENGEIFQTMEDSIIWKEFHFNNDFEIVKPFLISDEKIEKGDFVLETLNNGKYLPLTIQTENDLDIDKQKKIVALPEQIGKVIEYVEHENENSLWSSRKKVNLNIEHINEILNNQGDCKIQMITFEGDYCGYRIPKLEENKIIIEI